MRAALLAVAVALAVPSAGRADQGKAPAATSGSPNQFSGVLRFLAPQPAPKPAPPHRSTATVHNTAPAHSTARLAQAGLPNRSYPRSGIPFDDARGMTQPAYPQYAYPQYADPRSIYPAAAYPYYAYRPYRAYRYAYYYYYPYGYPGY